VADGEGEEAGREGRGHRKERLPVPKKLDELQDARNRVTNVIVDASVDKTDYREARVVRRVPCHAKREDDGEGDV